jgi:hypothetical protein
LSTVCSQGWLQPSLHGRTCGVSTKGTPAPGLALIPSTFEVIFQASCYSFARLSKLSGWNAWKRNGNSNESWLVSVLDIENQLPAPEMLQCCSNTQHKSALGKIELVDD